MSEWVWMDQGGTFTDVVRVDPGGKTRIEKVLTAHADLKTLGAAGARLRRGTTVATNALLEGQGVPTLLITTRGFRDLPWFGDQSRPELFELCIERPPPLCRGVLEASGRIDAQGAVQEAARVDSSQLLEWLKRGVRAVAIVLVHGPLAPGEERRIGEQCLRLGFSQVSLGHDVAPSRGFLARMRTTLADAALSPLLPRAPGLYMRSDGGLALESGQQRSEWRGCHAILSGPAGGVVATSELAQREGLARVIGFDMGGTSTDVSRVAGQPGRTDHLLISGQRLRVPAIRLETVAAGGGSLLQVNAGLYCVGPRSAGSEPGPACYGRGGPAALTDAEAVLGRLPGFPSVCGPERNEGLDLDAASSALRGLDSERSLESVALGFRAVAHEEMAAAIRRLAAARGVDPSDHALVAFGGAGPGHACGVAERLGITEVWVPHLAGVFSAVGIGMAQRRAECVEPLRDDGLSEARKRIEARVPFSGAHSLRLAARHQGTSELLELRLLPGLEDDPSGLREAFDSAHRTRFGFVRPDAPLEFVELRLSVEAHRETPELRLPSLGERKSSTTRAFFDGWRDVPLHTLESADGKLGPALIGAHGCTIVIERGWRAELRDSGLCLRHEERAASLPSQAFDPVQTAVLGSRLMGIAEQMGERLARLARSVSIRERRDFSCAVFDGQGQLVCNAPHIPVHLGAMGETLRVLLATRGSELKPGQHWVCNDPYAGGSHLPDITVMSPVFAPDAEEPLLFVACRGHHIDVGGSRPGSMPPDSRHIDEEGARIAHQLLSSEGRFQMPEVPGCREPVEVRADLEAQVAACSLGVAQLGQLIEEQSPVILEAQMSHLMNQAESAVREVLRGLAGDWSGREVLDDGTPIEVSLEIEEGEARVSIDGPAHRGNLNAPRAVARAALLYVFRCLVDEPLPLNEGALRPFQIEIEPGGLFDPQPPAAVAGGNVESSQRLVDALLQALGRQAGSQGTMNNLTIGTEEGTLYETIGGGSGASPSGPGADAVQVHMTNTPATDVEELEHRLPIQLESWRIRPDSGGAGRNRGGDGVEKTWRFLSPAEVSILAGRRDRGAPGLAGGRSGLPGQDLREQDGAWSTAPRQYRAEAGERLRIATPGGGGWSAPEPTEG